MIMFLLSKLCLTAPLETRHLLPFLPKGSSPHTHPTPPCLPTIPALLIHHRLLPITTPHRCVVPRLVFRKESRFLVGGQLGDLGMGREPHACPLLRECPSVLSGAPEIQVRWWGSQVCPRQDYFPLREASGGRIHCEALASQLPGPGALVPDP